MQKEKMNSGRVSVEKIKAVLFDAGDILYRRPRKRQEFETYFRNLGLTPPERKDPEMRRLRRLAHVGEISRSDYFEQVMDYGQIPSADRDEAKAFLDRIELDIEFEPDLKEMLTELRNGGLRLGIVTNSFESTETKLGWFNGVGIADLWDCFSTSSEVGVAKPDAELFLRALKKLDVSPEQAAFVGHTTDELEAAAALGMMTIAFKPDDTDVAADHVLDDLSKLPALFFGGRTCDFDERELVSAIGKWASCESPTSDSAGVNRMMDLVEEELSDVPVDIERIKGTEGYGDILVVRAGDVAKGGYGLMLSHLDTVHPVGTLQDHLSVRVEGDRLYGPGVADMKGGAYMGLAAMKSVVLSGRLRRPLVYVFTPDEEVGSPTSRALIEDLADRAEYCLVTEPSRPEGKVVTARRGTGRYEVNVTGRAAHSGSGQHIGRSAIREAARQILDLEALNDLDGRGISVTVGRIKGGSAENTIPEHAWFTVDLRLSHPSDTQPMHDRIMSLKPHDPDVRVEVLGQITRPPYDKNDGIAKLHRQIQEAGRKFGLTLDDIPRAGGASDANFPALMGVPTIDGLGIEGFGGHTHEEHALISSLVPRTRLLANLLETL